MVPIPKYLKPYATLKKVKSDTTVVLSLNCNCGSDFFDIYANYLTEDEKKVEKPYWEDIILGKPYFSGIEVLKAKCPVCGKQIVLFDTRTCGYDGVTEEHTEECMVYVPHFKQKGTAPVKIEITIENDPSLEEFKEAIGMDCTEDLYSNAFSWIQIHGISEEGKRKKLFDSETA